MAVKAADLESELIDGICERVRRKLATDRVAPCESFIRQFYHWVPAEDLSDRSQIDLYGAAIAEWNLAQQRSPGEAKVNVYNPDFEQHGWQSPHTVIEIISDDMPFIVDSVTMELGRQGYGIDLVIHPVVRVRRDDSRPADRRDRARRRRRRCRSRNRSSTPRSCASATRPSSRRLRENLERVLGEVRAAVEDWQAMRAKTEELSRELEREPPPVDAAEVQRGQGRSSSGSPRTTSRSSATASTNWSSRAKRPGSWPCRTRAWGSFATRRRRPFKRLRPKALELARAPHVLVLTKANSRSNVHRPAYLDYIGVKKFGPDGQVTGERRFLGLYTTAAYKASPARDPAARAARSRRCSNKRRVPTGQPRPQGAARDPRVLSARLAVPDERRRAVRRRDGDPRARRAPARAAVRPARRARPVRRVPGDDPARPLQHREPRARRRDPARGVRRKPSRLDAAAVGVACSRACCTSCTAPTACPSTTTSPRSRRGWRR